jgi:hypothetical protein
LLFVGLAAKSGRYQKRLESKTQHFGEGIGYTFHFFLFGLLPKGRFLLGFPGIGTLFWIGRFVFISTLFYIIPFFVHNFVPP